MENVQVIKTYFDRRRSRPVDFPARNVPMPTNALVEVTNGCNHSCVFCKNSLQGRKRLVLDLGIFKDFCQQAAASGVFELGLYSTGEPFIVKNLSEYIRCAKIAGIQRVYLTTNGALASLTRVKECVSAGLDSIKYSINAIDRETYKLVHGADDFDEVVANVSAVYSWKEEQQIDLQMLGGCVITPVLSEIEEQHAKIFSQYFESINYVQSNNQGGHALDFAASEEVISMAFFPVEDSKMQTGSPCKMLWNRVHLTAEGLITACCTDYNLNLVCGSLINDSLSSIWNGEVFTALRERHLDGKLEGTICDQCVHNQRRAYGPLTDTGQAFEVDEFDRSCSKSNASILISKRLIKLKLVN